MLLHCEEGLWYCITIFQIRHGVLESIVINTSWGILYKTRWDGAAAGGGGQGERGFSPDHEDKV